MPAPYQLAVDVGTSRTAAAIARTAPAGDLVSAALPLGRASDSAPTAVYVGEGELLFGDAAERRGAARPDRLVREFKRRVGDDVPIVAGDRHFGAEEMFALVVGWVVSVATEREGREPSGIAVTVPVTWGEYRTGLVSAALARHGWPHVEVVTEPEAAARHYQTTHPLGIGRALAVYDLGGGTFDAVVLAKSEAGVGVVGTPTGISDLGGADFDDAVVRHAVAAAGLSPADLAGSSGGRLTLAALRRECVEAKESLSFDSESVIPVLVGGEQHSVRLTRDEFELMIADDLERTATALGDALAKAQVTLDDLDAILLTGGSSRIPRVAQLLSERFDRPIAVDADPKAIIALGAARAAVDAAAPVTASADPSPEDEPADDDAFAVLLDERPAPAAAGRRRWFRRVPPTALAAGAFAVLLTGVGIAAAPALGSGAFTGQEARMTGGPLALAADEYGPVVPDGLVTRASEAQAQPAPTESAAQNPTSEPQYSNPRRTAQRAAAKPTDSTAKPTARPTTNAPSTSGGSTPSSPATGTRAAGPQNPSTQSPPAQSPATPAPSAPQDPAPQPSTPAPADPGTPPPAEPNPDPSEPSTEPTQPSTEPSAEPSADPPADPVTTATPAPGGDSVVG